MNYYDHRGKVMLAKIDGMEDTVIILDTSRSKLGQSVKVKTLGRPEYEARWVHADNIALIKWVQFTVELPSEKPDRLSVPLLLGAAVIVLLIIVLIIVIA